MHDSNSAVSEVAQQYAQSLSAFMFQHVQQAKQLNLKDAKT
jgi:hypothetical protein